jgi:hypothetical protein
VSYGLQHPLDLVLAALMDRKLEVGAIDTAHLSWRRDAVFELDSAPQPL